MIKHQGLILIYSDSEEPVKRGDLVWNRAGVKFTIDGHKNNLIKVSNSTHSTHLPAHQLGLEWAKDVKNHLFEITAFSQLTLLEATSA
jgi:hypothetical protein